MLEIGCGPGAAARAVANRLVTGHIVAIDRSARAVSQATALAHAEIAAGRMSVRQAAIEEFTLDPGAIPFDLVFAARVGALDGRHPAAGVRAFAHIAAVLASDGQVYVDGHPVRL